MKAPAACRLGGVLAFLVVCACDAESQPSAASSPAAQPTAPELTPTPVDERGFWEPPRVFRGDPVAQAKVDAEAAIVAGRPVLVVWGMPPLEIVDAKTGLPKASYGCEIDDNIKAYTDTYNAAIEAARAEGRVKRSASTER